MPEQSIAIPLALRWGILAAFLVLATSTIGLIVIWSTMPLTRGPFVGSTIFAESSMIASGLVFWGIAARKTWPCVVIIIMLLMIGIACLCLAVVFVVGLNGFNCDANKPQSCESVKQSVQAELGVVSFVSSVCGVFCFIFLKLKACIGHLRALE